MNKEQKKVEENEDINIEESNEKKEENIQENKENNIDYKDIALRALADLENYKKRAEDEGRAFKEFAVFNVISDFLPVYNHLQQAIVHIPEDQKELGWVKGVAMIANQFKDVLKNYNIEGYDVVGKDFDHNTMEAILTEKDETKKDNIVLKEMDPGYTMNGKIVKHARVVVNKLTN